MIVNHSWRRKKGQAALEFALVVPIFIILLFGIIDFARYFMVQQLMSDSLRTAARYAATGKTMEDPSDSTQQLSRRESIIEFARQNTSAYLDFTADVDEEKADDSFKLDPENGGNGGEYLTLTFQQDFNFITPFISQHVFGGKLETQLRIVNERFD